MDEYSDLDFFLVVEPGARAAYLHDIDWLRAAAPVAFDVRNSADGRKVFFADGIYAEYAVVEPEELAGFAIPSARVVWSCSATFEASVSARCASSRSTPWTGF
jgi:lincosamide nucleotidyltransferase